MRPGLLIFFLLAGARAFALTNEPAAPLLPNGGFEEADATNAAKPAGWDTMDGLGVRWETETNGPANRFIRMNTAVSEIAYVASCRAAGLEKWVFPNPANDPIAATYGLSYYSDSLPVVTGQAYRLTFRYRGASGGGKAWVRGYGIIRDVERRRYDTVVNCRTPEEGWTAFSQCFHPTKHTPTVTRMRIMLYAYWPPGVYAFDQVAVTPVTEAEWLADHRENE
jgi:hypothetical protein